MAEKQKNPTVADIMNSVIDAPNNNTDKSAVKAPEPKTQAEPDTTNTEGQTPQKELTLAELRLKIRLAKKKAQTARARKKRNYSRLYAIIGQAYVCQHIKAETESEDIRKIILEFANAKDDKGNKYLTKDDEIFLFKKYLPEEYPKRFKDEYEKEQEAKKQAEELKKALKAKK